MEVKNIHFIPVSHVECPVCGAKECEEYSDHSHTINLVLPRLNHDLSSLREPNNMGSHCHSIDLKIPPHQHELNTSVRCTKCSQRYNRPVRTINKDQSERTLRGLR